LNRHLINPTPTLPLPLKGRVKWENSLPMKGREIAILLPLQGGGWEGDGNLQEK